MTKAKVLAVIPARGGSKGVPQKNIRPVGGRPMIAYTIQCALAVGNLFHRVVVSTDDPKTAEIARQYGAEVPFMRPPELAADKSPTLPVLQHAVDFVEQQDGLTLDWVMLLQPTAPLRAPIDIEKSLELALQGGCDSVISVMRVFDVHPMLMKRIEDDVLLSYCLEEPEGTRRQDYDPPAYMRNGAIYLTKRRVLMEENSIWGKVIRPYVMPEERSLSIDNEMHMKLAEMILAERKA